MLEMIVNIDMTTGWVEKRSRYQKLKQVGLSFFGGQENRG